MSAIPEGALGLVGEALLVEILVIEPGIVIIGDYRVAFDARSRNWQRRP